VKFLKVYIKNFKGIKNVNILELDKGTTLLTGANGFGKTTIFDAIELCLTGLIHRTDIKKGVTNDVRDYKKPFFQNDESDEVTLKLWLENGKGQELIIVRHLHKDKDKRPKLKGKKYKANDFGILSLFTEDKFFFSQEHFNLDHAKRITQSDISNFFEFADKDIDINSIYHIFNYLQQEETTYFLKKSENERKNSLGFLLRTDAQEAKLKSITDKHRKLRELKDFFQNKLLALKLNTIENIEYINVFPDKNVNFDLEDPFIDVIDSNVRIKLDEYISKIDKLVDFRQKFKPDEYLIKEKSNKIKSLIINVPEFMEHYVLQNFLKEETYYKLRVLYNDINNRELIEAYILQNVLGKADHASQVNKNFENITQFSKAKNNEKGKYLKPLVTSFIPELLETYTTLMDSRATHTESLQGLNKSVVELKSTISDLETRFLLIQSHETKCKCPYCGTPFDRLEILAQSLSERLLVFDKLTSDTTKTLDKANSRFVNEIIEPTALKVSEFEKSHSKYDEVVIQKLKLIKRQTFDYSNIKGQLSDHSNYKWENIHSLESLNKAVDEVKRVLKSSFPIEDDVWPRVVKLSSKNYKEAYQIISNLKLSSKYNLKLTSSPLTITSLKESASNLSKFLEDYNSRNKYDPAKSEDPGGFYNKYFNSKKELFETIDMETLETKKIYLNFIANSKENDQFKIYEAKVSQIEKFISKIELLKEIYSDEIKSYKKEMIKRIQIPFFIYTAKILQNYQQGMGIFISVRDDSAIRFIANGESDHDIVHHLSSGQLAVVALAFCLAINKTFEISPNLKFLAIDDPVQEMDALNIHSFVDLVRSELSEDYQLIFSTHDYDNALFMKYKLEKVNKNSVVIIDVQQEFFPPLKSEQQ
jgi:exonuclease SbcC